jgi:hypothetical protein
MKSTPPAITDCSSTTIYKNIKTIWLIFKEIKIS